jgi:hypothetical protein
VWRSGRLPAATGSLLRIGIAPISVQGIAQTSGRDGGEVGEGFRLRLIDAISRLPGVQVPSAAAFATSNPDEMPHIARDLKLDDLLLGSIAARAPSTT